MTMRMLPAGQPIRPAETHLGYALLQALDSDLDGRICFRNYLRIYFPFATEEEIDTMYSWVHPEVGWHSGAVATGLEGVDVQLQETGTPGRS